ncbi:MAG: HAD-IC family P-type ATPase [Gammaproteobacteria bacterium]|nr:HAD-IC family P-type ATPase [Gammaproteobacteria bacterium]
MFAPHAHDITDVLQACATSDQGLSESEAELRRKEFGTNSLPLADPVPGWKRFLLQFHNVLIYVLLVSAFVSLLMGHYVDSGVIFAVVLVNAIVGYIQEGKAENALRAIMTMTRTYCMVIRDGALKSKDSSELVPGDIVMIQAGDRIPADVRLFYCKDLHCDESALTGEAQPAGKHSGTVAADSPLAERKNTVYMGTLATYGLARGVVCKTGIQTQIGEISELVNTVEMPKTPLQLQLGRFAQQLSVGIVAVSALTMMIGIFLRDYSFNEMFQAAIGIAVSAIPEGLPAIVTIALAIGVQRMAANRALVRRLPAVEVLGSVDVICSDKTGTLTANAMTVREVVTAAGHYRVGGEGYRPEGPILFGDTEAKVLTDEDMSLTRACLVAILCNDASLEHENDDWILHGDPTEGALLVLALKHGLTTAQAAHDWPRIDILPFESERRYMATLHHNADGQASIMVKGAPERLLEYSQLELGADGPQPLTLSRWQNAVDDFAGRGMRVMCLAYRDCQTRPVALGHDDIEHDLVIVGLVGITDPPRPEAIVSIRQCHAAGISVKMITGDNLVTATAIGRELGLDVSHVMTGHDIDTSNPQQLAALLGEVNVFARTSPANKLQLVSALQHNRHVVAMTGDGVNDSPALKQADIGVAMGKKGTDAAKDAADFILTDDNFSTIARAIAEGRTVYDNIVKSIIFILPTNLAEALVIFSAIMMGRMLPITAAQILWVNMITAVTLALSLAFERPEANIMDRPPRRFGQGLFSAGLLLRMILVGVLGAVVVFSLFYYYRSQGASIEMARTIAVNALVFLETYYLLNCRYLTRSIFEREFLRGIWPAILAIFWVFVFQLIFVYLPFSQTAFGLESIGWTDWLLIGVSALPVLFVVELEKYIGRRVMAARGVHQ